MLIEIAAADASTAWCISQASGCAMAAAYLPLATAERVWGDDPRAVLAWGQNQGARARVTDGGYIVTGTWSFVSGGHHATWIGGHSHIEEPDGTLRTTGGKPVERTLLIPQAAMTTTDDWDVIGLRGTGSDSFSVANHFVPHAYTLARDTDAERREQGPLYRFLTNHMYASGFAAVALGTARGLLDRFTDLARGKIPTLTGRALRDSQTVQRDLAIAEAQWRAARAGLLSALDEAWDAVATGPMPLDQRMAIRMAGTFAIRQAREVADFCWREAGATAIFTANGFERRYRDMITVTQQVQGRMIHFETVGQHLLGLSDASTRFA
jgi:indole-3-acetate monooxygenase